MKQFTRTFVLAVLSFLAVRGMSQTCTASFSYSLMPNGAVNFISTSTPVNSITTQYYWNFGNNSTFTATGNPTSSTTYSANGVYTVNLFFLTPSTCSNAAAMTITITNVSSGTCNINANFTWSQGSNGQVNFNNTSTGTNGGTTYSWNFGDSNSSTATSPSHAYAANGPYVVTLTASNGGTCTSVISKTVNVTSICNLNASFTHTLGTNGQVFFSSTATGTVSTSMYSWNFGDNTTGNGKNTSHFYTNGTYMVTHVVTNFSTAPTCTAVAYDTITVTNNTCTANAGFSIAPTATPQYWNAYPASPNNVVAAIWYWGDNTTSNSLYSSHTYSAAGFYTLCLSVTVSCGATDLACASYSIFRSSSENQMVHVNVIDMTTVGLDETAAVEFAVFPNPADKELLVNSNLENSAGVTAAIFNLTGAKVLEQPFKDHQKQLRIDTQALPPGVYILNVAGEGVKPVTQRIVIAR